jgi:hypothetical protein
MVSFTITPLTDHTGAEIIGLDHTRPVDAQCRVSLARSLSAPVLAPSRLHLIRPAPNHNDHPANNGGRKGRSTPWNTTAGGRLARLR